jgi:hypothetical protein
MITKEQIRKIKRGAANMKRPVLSMYLLTNDPSNRHENRVRARATMESLAAPDEMIRRVMAVLENPQNRSPTMAIFADEATVEVVGMPVDLPVIDPRTGHVEARLGEPYLSPLLLAFDQFERFFVVLIGRDRCRTFEVFLGEIEELGEAVRGPTPGEWDRLQHARQTYPAFIASRDHAGRERMERHIWEWVRRFYEDLGDEVEDAMNARGAMRLVLLGPDRDVSMFESFLSRPLRERVVAMAQGLPDPEAPASMVLERVRPIIESVEEERTRLVIDDAENQGARGTAKCLAELQLSRVHTVVAPWNLEDDVFETSGGYVAVNEADAKRIDRNVRKVPLKVVLPDLVSAYGARLTFARGENERRLMDDLGGVSGLLRW